jgi:DNA-binding response OmpR family regulator
MKRRILLVEDDSAVADYLTTFLAQEGFHVTSAGSLAQARAALAQAFDLVMLDLNLPDGTGDELVPAIIKAQPGVPVLMVTGAAADDDRVLKCLASGATDCVNKGDRIDAIARQLRRALGD